MLIGEKDPKFAGHSHSPDSRTAINHQIHKLVPTLIFGNIHIGNGNFLLPREQISTAGCRGAAITLKHYLEQRREGYKYCSDFYTDWLQISYDFYDI